MTKSQMDRMEEMLTSLISVVGNTNQKLEKLTERVDVLSKDMHDVKEEVSQVHDKLIDMHADQNYIWEKAAKNERELAILKARLQL
jgi:chromosome segregation ATPase